MLQEIEGVGPVRPQPAGHRPGAGAPRDPTFEQALQRARQRGAAQPLRFSAHAAARMRVHGIQLDGPAMQRLDSAVDLARSKGIRESLVVTEQASFIVSVPNASVITIVPRGAPRGDVFTQIDGAVII